MSCSELETIQPTHILMLMTIPPSSQPRNKSPSAYKSPPLIPPPPPPPLLLRLHHHLHLRTLLVERSIGRLSIRGRQCRTRIEHREPRYGGGPIPGMP